MERKRKESRKKSLQPFELLFHHVMGFAPYGEYYKNLMRIYATHMFYLRRIVAFGEFWAQVGAQMVKEIMGPVRKYNVVEVRKVLHFGLLSNVMKSIFGRRYVFGEGVMGVSLRSW